MLKVILYFCLHTKSKNCSPYHKITERIMSNKETAFAFVNEALSNQDASVIGKITRQDLIQHNPFVPDGLEVVVNHLFPALEAAGTHAESMRVIEDGDYVVMHNHWKNASPFGNDEMAAFDIYRFDEEGKIAEHWDALQPNAGSNPSNRTMFDGPTEITDLEKTEENKARAEALFHVLIHGTQEEAVAAVISNFEPNYKQHNPTAGDGLEGFTAAMPTEQWVFTKQHKVLGEGNFVLSIAEGTHKGIPSAFYDLLRFENGKIVEHWDVIQPIPTENLANSNSMFNFK